MATDKSKLVDLNSFLAPAGKSSWAEESEQEIMEKPAAAAPKKAWGAPVASAPAAKSSEKAWPTLENAAAAPAKKDEPAPRSAPRETRGGDYPARGGYDRDSRGGYERESRGNQGREREYDDRRGGYGDDRRGGYGDDRRGGYGDDRRGGYGDDRPRREERAPREPVPIPETAPFTAYVGNLPFEADETLIEELFEDLAIKDVRIVMDRETRRSKGYGYVEFQDQESLKKAVELSGKEFQGRAVRIDVAEQKRPQERRDDRGGNRRGGDSFFGKDRYNNPEPREVRERPRLNLQPRTLPVETAEQQAPKKPKEDPFGGAAPKSVKDPFAQPIVEKRESPKEPAKQEDKPRREAPRAEAKPDDSRAAQSDSWRRPAGDASKLPQRSGAAGPVARGNDRRPASRPDSDGWQQQEGGRRGPRQENPRRFQQPKEADSSNARDATQGNAFDLLGRLVDYGSDDDVPVETAPAPCEPSSGVKSVLEANEKGKKRSADDGDVLASKARKISDNPESPSAQTIAANRLRVNAKSLLSVLPEPASQVPAKRSPQVALSSHESRLAGEAGVDGGHSSAANSVQPTVGPAKPDSEFSYPYYPEYTEFDHQRAHEMCNTSFTEIEPTSSWARELARTGGQLVDVNARQIYDPTTARQGALEREPMMPQKQFSKTAKQRHQLSTLAAQSREQEKQLAAKKAQGMKSKAETRAKYGW